MGADEKPKQKTPKGAEIPVPSREDVMRDLAKVALKPPAKECGEDGGDR
jgi:hypothetical protein